LKPARQLWLEFPDQQDYLTGLVCLEELEADMVYANKLILLDDRTEEQEEVVLSL
jgi:hypothetical protein